MRRKMMTLCSFWVSCSYAFYGEYRVKISINVPRIERVVHVRSFAAAHKQRGHLWNQAIEPGLADKEILRHMT